MTIVTIATMQSTPRAPRTTRNEQVIVIPDVPAPPPPGVIVQGSQLPYDPNQIPSGAVDISIAFFVCVAVCVVGFPLARALARRMDRGTSAGAAHAQVPAEVADRLTHIEHAVDSIALEVERISEGQRFTTKLLSDAGPRVALPAREGAS